MSRGDKLRREWLLLKVLERPHGVTLKELEDALPDDYPKNPRTLRRDLEAIDTVFPLEQDREDGTTRWKLAFGAKAPLPGLAPTEMIALSFCKGMLTPLEGTPIKESLKNATDKIEAMLPETVKRYVREHSRTISYGPGPHKEYDKHKHAIDTLHQALDGRRTVRLLYRSHAQGRTTSRDVDPYNLRYASGAFYLVGYCHIRKEVRLFAVDRIKSTKLLKATFELPPDFDIEKYMSPAFGVMRGDPVEVSIGLSPKTAAWVTERTWHPSQQLSRCADGYVRSPDRPDRAEILPSSAPAPA